MDFRSRSRQLELMDAEDVDPGELSHALDHLVEINRRLNGYAPSLTGVKRLLPPDTVQVSLLDVGCGSGDMLRRIADWARKHRLKARLVGIELSDVTADRARAECRGYPEIEIRRANLFDVEGEAFDVVHCALMLHHFSDDADAVAALRKMLQLAKQGIVVNDLHRHWLAYHSISILTRLLSRSRILQHDARLSVARGFTRSELVGMVKLAGAGRVTCKWRWAFRWQLLARGAAEPK